MVNILKPSVCFEVEKVIGISTTEGNCKTYQVLWAPTWISGAHLVGCEDLIAQFEDEQKNREDTIKVEVLEVIESEARNGLLPNDEGNEVNEDNRLPNNLLNHSSDSNLLRFVEDVHNNVDSRFYTPVSHPHFDSQNTNNNSSVSPVACSDWDTQDKDQNSSEQSQSRNTNTNLEIIVANACPDRISENGFRVLSFQSQINSNNNHDVNGGGGTSPNDVASTFTVTQHPQTLTYLSKEDSLEHNRIFEYNNVPSEDAFSMNKIESTSFCGSVNNVKIQKIRSTFKKTFQCNVCNRKFTSHVSLQRHLQVHTTVKDLYQCAVCCRKFANKVSLQKHELTHSGEKQVVPTAEKQVIHTGEKQVIHTSEKQVIHTGEKQVIHTGEKQVIHTGEKQVIHTGEKQVIHTGEKQMIHTSEKQVIHAGEKLVINTIQLSCSVCKEQFTDNFQLLAHVKTHGRKNYPNKCQMCAKIFLTATDLKRHIRVHTGERPFQCNICYKRFKIKHHLQGHLKTHGQERPSMCGNV